MPVPTLRIDFAPIRQLFGGTLTQSQVDGINVIVAAFGAMGDGSVSHLAYLLATAKWETDHTMQPIAELGRGKGKQYGRIDSTGKAPYGRGYVQLTWAYNYKKADQKLGLGGKLAENYDLALDPTIAAKILVRGCIDGWFTGQKLSDFSSFQEMRRVVNGIDKADVIAGYANTFLSALGQPQTAPTATAPKSSMIATAVQAILSVLPRKTTT